MTQKRKQTFSTKGYSQSDGWRDKQGKKHKATKTNHSITHKKNIRKSLPTFKNFTKNLLKKEQKSQPLRSTQANCLQ
jgi:uncharacterized protein YecE (DUF72 family)